MNYSFNDCMYCAGTGRTKFNKFYCEHCGRHYRDVEEDKFVENELVINGYPINSRQAQQGDNWSPDNCLELLDKYNRPYTPYTEKILQRLDLELFKLEHNSLDGEQLLISIDPSIYEAVVIPWAYKFIKTALINGYDCTNNIENLEIFTHDNIYDNDLIYKDILVIEYILRDIDDKSLGYIESLVTSRKRNNLPTIIITKTELKIINRIRKGLAYLVNLDTDFEEVCDICLLTGIAER